MINSLLVAIIPIILTGIAFLSYNQPIIAKKVLSVIFICCNAIYFLLLAYCAGLANATLEIQETIGDKKDIYSFIKILQNVSKSSQNLSNNGLLLLIISATIVIIFYFLSNLFEKVKDKDSNKINDSPNKTPK